MTIDVSYVVVSCFPRTFIFGAAEAQGLEWQTRAIIPCLTQTSNSIALWDCHNNNERTVLFLIRSVKLLQIL